MAEGWRPSQAVVVMADICPPFLLSFTIWFITVMMKHDCISGTDHLATSRQTQPKVQHMVTTFTGNTYRVIWSAIKNLTTLGILQSIAYYHWQTWCLFCLKVVIISFSFREVISVRYGNPHSTCLLTSSSMVVPWLPITLPPLMCPWRTATIQGFWKAPSPAEVVTVSPRMTPVTSKFNLLTEAVTTSMYHLSSSVWSDGVTSWPVLCIRFSWKDCDISLQQRVCKARQGMPNIICSREGNRFNWWGLLRWRSEQWGSGTMYLPGFSRASDVSCGGRVMVCPQGATRS